jgi:predicted PurR-regulated permease PerM
MNRSYDAVSIAAYVLTGLALYLLLALHLLSGLIAGLLVFVLVQLLAPLLDRRFRGQRARLAAVATLAVVIIAVLLGSTMATVAFFRSDTGNIEGFFAKTQQILDDAHSKLPASVVENLPDTVGELRDAVKSWTEEHKKELSFFGKEASQSLLHIVIGMIVGALVSLREQLPERAHRPLSAALVKRVNGIADAFRRIIFAQVRISALNTVFTAVFLLVILPLFGVHLPLDKTLVALTFIAGLLPVVGNLISNSVLTIVGLSVSASAGLACLAFLIIIHKLEYFFNAKIVGSHINARAWELLVAMFTMEAAFGLDGLVAAPIYYAYIKSELAALDLI